MLVNNRAQPHLIITGGRIIDPARDMDLVGDVLIKNGIIEKIGGDLHSSMSSTMPSLDASRMIVCPGFIDLHTHLREPGFEDKETIDTGVRAGAAGGFTTLCCMPNTNPPIDCRAVVEFIGEKSSASDSSRVFVVGCVSKGRKGEELAEMGELAEAGAVAFSDDGSPVHKSSLMRSALEYSKAVGLPIINHCEDPVLSAGGVMNEGFTSTRLGLKGIPNAAEETVVSRDVILAVLTGCRVHIAHVSTEGSVRIVREAKSRGVKVTAETAPHYFSLSIYFFI